MAFVLECMSFNLRVAAACDGVNMFFRRAPRVLEVLERYNINVEYLPSGIDSVSLVVETGKAAPYLYQAVGDVEKDD